MAHQPPWNLQYMPPRIEQGTDFELELFEGAPYDPDVPPGSRPTPAPGHVSVTGSSDGYDAGTMESAPFTASSTFRPAYPAGFSMQQDPMSNNIWNPTSPSPPTQPSQFHGYGLSTWMRDANWQVSNVSSLSGSHSLVAAQAAALQPGPLVLRSSPGSRSAIATYPYQAFGMASDTAPAVPQQPHSQAASGSTPSAFFRRQFQRLRHPASQDSESCWRCKSDHKKCEPGTPCPRCATAPSPGKSPIPCRRGRACDAAAEIPFLCHMQQGAPHLRVESLPPDFQDAANHLSQARQRRRQIASQIKGCEPEAGSQYGVFCRVVNTEVPNIRCFNPFVDLAITLLILPYDNLIANIVWELEDNQEAAQLTGVGSVEDLVALLEAACLCEAQTGHQDQRRRLVYNSILCLQHSMEALRLSAHGLLAADAHAGCHQANQCISPAFHGLTRYALRYAEALNTTLFHKRRGKHSDWLLAFYSLCLQGHVRRALVSLEKRLQSAEVSAGRMEAGGFARPLCSANYLQTAVCLFEQISMQNRGKLAKQIRDSRPKPSVYLQQPPHPSRPGGESGSSSSWQKWREEGIPEFLRSHFQISTNDSTIHYHQHHTEPPGTGADSDSDVTIASAPAPAPAPAPPATVTATATAAITPTAMGTATTAQVAGGGVRYADVDSRTISSSRNTPEPSIINSMWSRTSYGENSGASSFYAGSLTPSGTSYAGSLTPSLSTVTLEDDMVENNFWL
ncbi:hypothetical protein MAPG_07839 [Magnaporthiopsis poae ATCC 64411]|uniref:Uncharacterized protein n=1 Tax=Magnaporthiopsis poae (strain ATCC 64411 / 73-15) TaxID=644358 RepID=A0A0C4E5R5_MAGP6|nr:hypothetical protein MAPG_07839 [Magnaporthiopsis poae ATCC 64411]